jgi:type IV pilus assembly protein PilC
MPVYIYKARNLNGKVVSGFLSADNENELKKALIKEDLYLNSFKIKKDKNKQSFFSFSSSRVKQAEVITFCRQFAIMINAGVTIVDSIDTLKDQSSPKMKQILSDVHAKMLVGKLLSEALGAYPKIFPNFFRNMIYIGELSGNLDSILLSLASYYEKDNKIKRKAKSALVYPSILGVLIVGVVGLLSVMVIPQFEDMLTQMDADMPKITQIVLDVSRFIQSNLMQLIVGVILFVILLRLFFSTKKGRYVRDTIKLSVPMLRQLNVRLITARFARGFGVLVESGLAIVDSMDIMATILDNKVIERKFRMAVDEIRRGKRIAYSLGLINIFPKMLIEMIAVGESTGSLEDVLLKTADYFDDVVESTITKLTTMLEPLMICVMASVVGTVIIAIMLPMVNLMSSVGV